PSARAPAAPASRMAIAIQAGPNGRTVHAKSRGPPHGGARSVQCVRCSTPTYCRLPQVSSIPDDSLPYFLVHRFYTELLAVNPYFLPGKYQNLWVTCVKQHSQIRRFIVAADLPPTAESHRSAGPARAPALPWRTSSPRRSGDS